MTTPEQPKKKMGRPRKYTAEEAHERIKACKRAYNHKTADKRKKERELFKAFKKVLEMSEGQK